MKIIRDCFERREPVPKEYEAYVDPLKDKDVVAAFESLTILLACVQELEAQRDWLASKLGDMCSVSSRGSCGVPEPCPYSKGYCRCLDVEQEEWIQIVKETKC